MKQVSPLQTVEHSLQKISVGNPPSKVPQNQKSLKDEYENETKSSMSLRSSVLIFVGIALASVFLTSFLPPYLLGVSALEDVSNQLSMQITKRIHGEVLAVLNSTHELLSAFDITMSSWTTGAEVIYCDNMEARRAFAGILMNKTTMSQAFMGFPDGGIIGIVTETGRWAIMCRDVSTDQYLNFSEDLNSETLTQPLKNLRTRIEEEKYYAYKRPWYIDAVNASRPVWGRFYFSYTSTVMQLALPAVKPIYVKDSQERNGRLVGVGAIEMNLGVINNILHNIEVARHGSTYVVDKSGQFIASTLKTEPARGDELYRYQDTEQPLITTSGKKIFASDWFRKNVTDFFEFTFSSGGKEYLTLASRLVDPRGGLEWIVVVIIEKDEIYGKSDESLVLAISLSVSMFFVIIVGSLIVSNSMAKSLEQITDNLRKMSLFGASSKDEKRLTSNLREIQAMQASFQEFDKKMKSRHEFAQGGNGKRVLSQSQGGVSYLEMRNVTIMFADLARFSSLTRTLDCDTVSDVLSGLINKISGIALSNGGTVIDYIGSCVVVAWNAPTSTTDHATCACAAALEILKEVEKLNAQWLEEHAIKQATKLRIGIHTSEVLVGNTGSLGCMKYDAVGEGVDLACKLKDLNNVYESNILISQETMRQCSPRIVHRPLERVVFTGKFDTKVHELLVDKRECDSEELIRAEAQQDATKALDGFDQAAQDKRQEAIDALAAYCASNPNDKPMKALSKIITLPSYDGTSIYQ